MDKSKNPLRSFEYRDAANELHRKPRKGPAERVFRRVDEVEARWTDTYAVHGVVVACSEHRLIEGEEGRIYREKWVDAQGNKHRDHGPAVIYENEHYIREETYLDKAKQEFWKHGKMVAERNTTYQDIVSHKPLAVRQAFGYDV